MFEAQLKKSSIFKNVLEAIRELLNEAQFNFTESGLSIQEMDNSHVSLVSLNIGRDGFDKYRCDKSMTLGINLGTMIKILRCSAGDDILTLRTRDEDTLRITLESPKFEKVSEYDMKLLDLEYDHLSVSDTEYSCVVTMASGEFLRVCKVLSQFGESTEITCDENGIKFSSSNDLGSANIRLNRLEADVERSSTGLTLKVRAPVTTTFATRFLNAFTKASPLSPQVTLSMSAGIPLAVEYQIGDAGLLCFYLAPKVNDNDP